MLQSRPKIHEYWKKHNQIRNAFNAAAKKLKWTPKHTLAPVPGCKSRSSYLRLSASHALNAGKGRMIVVFNPFTSRLKNRNRHFGFTIQLAVPDGKIVNLTMEKLSEPERNLFNSFSDAFTEKMNEWLMRKKAAIEKSERKREVKRKRCKVSHHR